MFVHKIKKLIIPSFLKEWKKRVIFNRKLNKVQKSHRSELNRIRSKEKIRVVFLLVHESVWKYEGLYRLMEQDERFEPVVVVCPYTKYGKETMFREMNQAYATFKEKGYDVIKSFDEEKNKWIDIKLGIKPDVVCFTNPWNLTRHEYCIENFLDQLTCYVPYGFKCSHLNEAHYNKPMQNLVWKFFIETNIHKKLSKKYAKNNGENVVVTGYPGMDKLLEEIEIENDPWKIKDPKIKRIIWAPHHSIPGYGANLDYSTFMDYHQFILNLAKKLQDEIQIAFKPHPILRSNLSRAEVWGRAKTDAYYKAWENLDNGLLVEGDYLDLFKTSDALIHDSGSFVIEYLYMNNPVQFLWSDESVINRFNEIGQSALKVLYRGDNKKDIENFIKQVVLNNNDKMKNKRRDFFNDVLKPPNSKTASENMFNEIKKSLQWK